MVLELISTVEPLLLSVIKTLHHMHGAVITEGYMED